MSQDCLTIGGQEKSLSDPMASPADEVGHLRGGPIILNSMQETACPSLLTLESQRISIFQAVDSDDCLTKKKL